MSARQLAILERRVAELSRQLDSIPVRLARAGGGGGGKKSSGTAAIFTGEINGTIPAGDPAAPTEGTGLVYEVEIGGKTTLIGTHKFWNPFPLALARACTLSQIINIEISDAEAEYLIIGWTPDPCETITVVTSVACVNGQVQGLTDELRFLSGPCPGPEATEA